MSKEVDSYRFIGGISKRMIRSWIKLEPAKETPWTPLSKPLSACTVALVSSGGIALKSDPPFDAEGERRNPWWGDPSYRVIPRGTSSADIRVCHLHLDPNLGQADLNCLLPLDRLDELVERGQVGRAAARHYSLMGYILEPEELLQVSTPAIIERLGEDAVDVVVLVPS